MSNHKVSGKAGVEVVMECNIRARAIVSHSGWAPCATSTPLRKPLVTLNNAGAVPSFNKCDFIPSGDVYKPLAIEKAEGKDPKKRNKNVTKKTSNKNSRIAHYLDDDDDDDDSEEEETGSQSKKQLIIKVSSNPLNKRSPRKKTPVMDTDPRSNEHGKDIELHDSPKASNDIGNCNGNNNIISPQKQDSANNADAKETTKKLKTSHNSHDGKSDNNNEINGIVQQKGKNKTLKMSRVKRQKTESDLTSKTSINKKKTKLINNNVKSCQKVGRISDIINKEGLARLSVSHEIFSGDKERECRDSLVLTPADHEELPECDLDHIKLPITQKTKRKVANSRQTTKAEPSKKVELSSSDLSRPKRVKKSPKEFWLLKSKESDEASSEHSNDAVEVKVVKDDNQISSSTEKPEEPEGMVFKVSTSTDAGGSSGSEYVKSISELDFKDHTTEDEKEKFSVAVGWHFPTFKCCVLKINVRCEASKTKSTNTHFGGIVLKGTLSMKIGETEVKMKEGQMFYVPPLTDWRAINIGRGTSVIYYWVGKLK